MEFQILRIATCVFVFCALPINGQQQSCMEKANSSPNARHRFSDAQLSRLCRREEQWNSNAIKSFGRSLDDLLSPEQASWFNSIEVCDFLCICGQVPICKKLMETFGGLISTFTGQGGNLNSGIEDIERGFKQISNGQTDGSGLSSIVDVFKGAGRRRRKRRMSVLQTKRTLLRAKRQLTSLRAQLPPVRRKEYRMMTDDERNRLHNGLNRLKNDLIGSMSKYDILVVYHRAENSPGAHFGPAFLPFHRELIRHLETALRLVDPRIAMPFWDTTLDERLPDPTKSIIWSGEFLGGGNGILRDGPFRNWRILNDEKAREVSPGLQIVRNLGKNQFGSLMKPSDVRKITSATEYRDLTFCIDPFFELVHGAVHMWIGGLMDPLELSPSDPVFFMLHAWVDQLWETWRQRTQTPPQRASDYPPNNEACNSFHFADAIMKPFKISNKMGLRSQEELYEYDSSPICSPQNPDCGSPYIFCDRRGFQCISKVTTGANCQGFEGTDICYQGSCVQGRCVRQAQPRPQPRTEAPRPRTRPPTQPVTRPPTRRPTTRFSPFTRIRTFTFTDPPTPRPSPRQPTSTGTVWFPITVQKYKGRFASPASEAIITSRDLRTNRVLRGEVSEETTYPFFTGAAFVQAPSPEFEHVDLEIDVKMPDGTPCTSLCLSQARIYLTCTPRASLDSNPDNSDPIPFTPVKEQVPYLNWEGPLRKPDPFLFLCKSGNSDLTPDVNEVNKKLVKKRPTVKISKEAERCLNLHRCCQVWSNGGECERNANWMASACRRSCNICIPTVPTLECRDLFGECPDWKLDNECNENPIWMEANCPRSCGVCGRSLDQLKKLCGAPDRPSCNNFDNQCDSWAGTGECQNNAWWMEQNCPLACQKCSKVR